MEDDDSSSSLNPTVTFTSEKVQRGVVTTTTTEDEDDESSRSNSNNEVLAAPEPVSSANTTTDSMTGTGDGDIGCSPTSTGLNSTTEDADVEDNSSPKSGERVTTSSSSSSDGYNFEERPHSQRVEKNSLPQEGTSDKSPWGDSRPSFPGSGSSFKCIRPSTFAPFGRTLASTNGVVGGGGGSQFSSSSGPAPFLFGNAPSPNPFAVARPPGVGLPSSFPVAPPLYQQDLPARNSMPFASTATSNEGKCILRPSSLLAVSCFAPSGSAPSFSVVRNPFGSTSSSSTNSVVTSSSIHNNPFNSNSVFGSKQDDFVAGSKGQLFGGSNSTGGDDVAITTTTSFVESSSAVMNVGTSNNILRQSKLSNVHYPCTSSDNSEARNSAGKIDSTQGESPLPSFRQQPSTSTTISSEAAAKFSIPAHNNSSFAASSAISAGGSDDSAQPSLFRSITSSVSSAFSQSVSPPTQPSTGTATESTSVGFVFGSNISDRVVGASASGRSPENHSNLPNGVSSTSTSVDLLSNIASYRSSEDGDGAGAVHSSTQDGHFQGSSITSSAPEVCFASSSSIGDRKRKLSEQMTTTGEENESNVLQASCKLFVYDGTTSAWVERGQGQLRLNDRVDGDEPPARKESPRGSGCGSTVANQGYDGEEDVPARPIQSRLIVRTKGSLRLMLNTNVWSGMKVERPSEKSVRFTGNDNGTIRIFVVQSSATDAEVLCNALTCRIRALLSYEAENPGAVVDPAPVYPTSSQTHQTLSQQSSSSGGYSAASGSGSGEFTVKHKREEIDSSEFDDSDEEVLDKTDEEGEDTPHTKKKRISSEPEEGASETPSPSTTTNEDIIPEREPSVGLGFQHGSRSNIVPSIQVDKPEARSDEDEDDAD